MEWSWVDTHCHLQLDSRPAAELLNRATDVAWVVVPGVDAASSRAALELATSFPDRILATAGLHPHEAERWPDEEDAITELAKKAAAIGETGLDFYRNLAPPDAQKKAFIAQLDLAAQLQKPVVIHCRDAFAQIHTILERQDLGTLAVLHCWTGGTRWTKRFLDLGCWFSFAGPVAFETGETIRLGAALVPPERALVETDTPFLSPPPFRQQPNEPGRVRLIGEALAGVWSLPVNEVARITSANAATVFKR
ncbi:MAG: TatD family hydrolase [Acidimicrobiia bacterium]